MTLMPEQDISTCYIHGEFNLANMDPDETHDSDTSLLIVIPQGLVEADNRFHQLSWRDFRSLVPQVLVKEVRQRLAGDDHLLDSTEPFDPSTIPGSVVTGLWPEWPGEGMYYWLPRAILDQFGEPHWLNWGETILKLNPGSEDDIVSDLSRLGYSSTRDSETVYRICHDGWQMWDTRS